MLTEVRSPPFYKQLQQLGSFSVSLNMGNGRPIGLLPAALHLQHSVLGLQLGFSQTNSHLGLGHLGF